MARISVSNLSGLSNFGSSISRFSDNYRSAIGSTYRSFQMKVDGEQAEAISAFLAKLNQVQATVFDTYPTVLDSYAQAISHYEDRLRGLGFQTRAWTDDAGASSVSGKLTGEQIDHIQEVKNKLQSAMNQASDALDISDFSLDGKVSGMEANLMEAGRRRTEMDQKMQEAYESFMRDLDLVLQNFESLKGPLANAQSVIQIPVASIATAIQNGSLAADEMYALSYVTNKDSRIAFQSVIGSAQDASKIKEVNPENISEEMYYFMTGQLESWVQNERIEHMNSFYSSLGTVDPKQNQILFQQLNVAGQKRAVAYQVLLMNEYDTNGNRFDTETMKKLLEHEEALNHLMGINRGLYIISYGEEIAKVRPGTMEEELRTTRSISFERTNRGQAWEFIVKNAWGGEKTYNSSMVSDDAVKNNEEYIIRFAEIEEAEKQARVDLLVNLGKIAIEGGTLIFAPQLFPVVSTILNLTSSSLSERTDEMFALQGLEETKIAGVTGSLVKVAESLMTYNSSIAELSAEEHSTILKMRSNILDKGAWLFKGGSENRLEDSYYFDFKVTARILELDRRGVMGYFEEHPEDRADFERSLKEDLSETVSPEIIDYALGKDTDLNLNEMNGDQLIQLNEVMKMVGDKDNKYLDYLENKYDILEEEGGQ
ncbi:TPA: hypothetical protein ACGPA6_001115 [Streptococcus suis]